MSISLQNKALKLAGLSSTQKLVLYILCTEADKNRMCSISIESIAIKVSKHTRTVKRCITELVNRNLIKRISTQTFNLYRIDLSGGLS